MANFLADIVAKLGDETIEKIVVGKFGYPWDDEDNTTELDIKGFPKNYYNKLLDWELAKDFLDYDYNDGYGGEDCHPIYAWTPTRILFVCYYDNATWVDSIPRNPDETIPKMFGGG